jgi:hypothetical protein
MPDIRISELPLATGPTAPVGTDVVAIDNGSTRKATLSSLAPVIRPFASQAEAEAGTDNTKTMTPLTTAQAMAAVSATVAQGAKADTAMQPTIYDPNTVAKDAFTFSSSDIAVTRYGALTSNTSAQNETAFNAAETAAAGRPIYVPDGTFQLSTPLNRGYKARYYGPGILRFDNAEWLRPGGSSGSISVPERYTLFYDYANQADVSVSFNGTPQTITWVDDSTVQAPGSLSTDAVRVNIVNGTLRLGGTPLMVRSFNAVDNAGSAFAPSQTSATAALTAYCNWSYGTGTPIALTTGINNTFGGSRSGRTLKTGSNNTFYGFQTGYRATGNSNTAVGSISGEWLTTGQFNSFFGALAGAKERTGSYNTAAGYDAFGENETGSYNVAIGHRALANPREDLGPTGSPQETVAVGVFAGDFSFGNSNVWAGYRAGNGAVGGSDGFENVGVGYFALRNHAGADYNVAVGVSSLLNLSSGQQNVAVGHSALAAATTIGGQVAVGYQSLTASTTGTENTAVGTSTLKTNTTGSSNTAMGVSALELANSANNSAYGVRAGAAVTSGQGHAFFGFEAGRFAATTDFNAFFGFRAGRASTGGDNTAIGGDALVFNTTGIQNTALGRAALRLDQAAANQTTYSNTTGVGYLASVSGSNQVQLGNSSTTTYVYGTVQNRSDARDKADIRDTELGLDFIMSLRPVDYRWDMREDYITFNEATGKVKRKKKDGSKKRTRFHHGFIAQELAECGFDFGGLQDHSKAGGADVMTVGYDEMIAPLVKAVQELTKRIKELEGE